jgi:hypothetical protein
MKDALSLVLLGVADTPADLQTVRQLETSVADQIA